MSVRLYPFIAKRRNRKVGEGRQDLTCGYPHVLLSWRRAGPASRLRFSVEWQDGGEIGKRINSFFRSLLKIIYSPSASSQDPKTERTLKNLKLYWLSRLKGLHGPKVSEASEDFNSPKASRTPWTLWIGWLGKQMDFSWWQEGGHNIV